MDEQIAPDEAEPQYDINMGPSLWGALNGGGDDAAPPSILDVWGGAPVAGGLAPSGEGGLPEEVRARADKLISTITPEDRAGLKDLQKLTLTMGLPAARIIFQYMIAAANLHGNAKKDAMAAVAKFSPLTEVGCMKVDFFNRGSGAPEIAYLVLGKCAKLHNLGEQLDKLKPHVSDAKWPEVIRSLSMLVHIGRSVYGQIARNHIDLIRRINGRAPDDPCAEFIDLQVDRENTTLFINDGWPRRVGIFIRLGGELPTAQSPYE